MEARILSSGARLTLGYAALEHGVVFTVQLVRDLLEQYGATANVSHIVTELDPEVKQGLEQAWLFFNTNAKRDEFLACVYVEFEQYTFNCYEMPCEVFVVHGHDKRTQAQSMIENESTENCSMSDSSSPYWITAPKFPSETSSSDSDSGEVAVQDARIIWARGKSSVS